MKGNEAECISRLGDMAAASGQDSRGGFPRTKMKGIATCLALLAAAGALKGCENGSDKGSPGSAGIDLTGTWKGQYQSPTQSIDIQAKVVQTGDSVVLQSTKEGPGRLLTGNMDADGKLRMTDAVDGETWTSFGDVTSRSFIVRDYLYDPLLKNDSPDQRLVLRR